MKRSPAFDLPPDLDVDEWEYVASEYANEEREIIEGVCSGRIAVLIAGYPPPDPRKKPQPKPRTPKKKPQWKRKKSVAKARPRHLTERQRYVRREGERIMGEVHKLQMLASTWAALAQANKRHREREEQALRLREGAEPFEYQGCWIDGETRIWTSNADWMRELQAHPDIVPGRCR